jgi:hypothetical protein
MLGVERREIVRKRPSATIRHINEGKMSKEI